MDNQMIPRALLAQITRNPQAIQYLEDLGRQANEAPGLLEQVQVIAQAGIDAATSAGQSAARAEALAVQLQSERAASQSLSGQIETLRRRVADLEALVLGD